MKLSKSNYLKLTCSFFNFLLSHSYSVNFENLFSLSLSLVRAGAGELSNEIQWIMFILLEKKIIFSHFFLAMLGRENVFSSISSRFVAHNFLSRLVFSFPIPSSSFLSCIDFQSSSVCSVCSTLSSVVCAMCAQRGKSCERRCSSMWASCKHISHVSCSYNIPFCSFQHAPRYGRTVVLFENVLMISDFIFP